MGRDLFKAVSITVSLAMLLTTLVLLVNPGGVIKGADAAKSPEKDAFGYLWVDNKDPGPKVTFDWIDATEGTKTSLNGDDTYTTINLPFPFTFYGRTYSQVSPTSNGLLCLYYRTTTYSNRDLPNSYVRGNIAPWWDDTSVYNSRGSYVYYITGQNEYGVNYIAIEWYRSNCPYYQSGSSYEITYEVILYEDGMIKIQYLDATTNANNQGSSATVGIQSHDSSAYTQYSNNKAVLFDGTAIMFGSNVAEVDSVVTDSDEGGVMYAQHRNYKVEARVRHPIANDMLKQTGVVFGNNLAEAVCHLDGPENYFFSVNDPNGYLSVDPATSYVEEDEFGYLNIVFFLSPTFNYPTNNIQDMVISTGGVGVMPGTKLIEGAFYVENKLEMSGQLLVFSDSKGLVENGGWVAGGENFNFRGARAVYPETSRSPMPGAITYIARDELDNEWTQDEVERDIDLPVVAENDFVKKVFNVSIGGVPDGTDLSNFPAYILYIDPFKPQPPVEIKIHADSFDDRNTEFDDDNEVYVTWEPAEDFESGISGYYVSEYDPLVESEMEVEPIWVQSPDTSTKLVFQGVGSRKVWVWSVDKAGNPSVPGFGITKIDADEVIFSEFSPGHQFWVSTHTPVCSILIDDVDGSGVAAKDVQFSVSTSSINEYTAWTTVKIPRDAPQLRASSKTTLENGKTNWIRFRAKDVAGNGWTQSEDYNVWVDEESPSFTNFRPYESEYQNGNSVVISMDIADKHGNREGSGVDVDNMEYRFSTDGIGLFGDWLSMESTTITTQSAHIEMELEFEEGTENYIQFRSYDEVGNFAQSKHYNIKVNSEPLVEAMLSSPINGMDYTTDEKILFDASSTSDPDGDDLDFTWYSDIDDFLSNSESFFRTLSPGKHTITLIVNDPAHSFVLHFDITVLEQTQIDPETIDTDGDGMYDAWEMKFKLNPYRPDGFIDSDHDMFTNYQEFQNNTDPTLRSNHPPYPPNYDLDQKDDENLDVEYRTVTIGVILISFVIVVVLILLAISRRGTFKMEVEDEQDLESEEMDYRQTLDRKKAERLSSPDRK